MTAIEAKYKRLVEQMRLVLCQPEVDYIRMYSLQDEINALRKQHPKLFEQKGGNNTRIQG